MKGSSTFKLVITGVFVAFALVGFLGFSGFIPLPGGGGKDGPALKGEIEVWGTFPQGMMNKMFEDIFRGEEDLRVSYTEKHESSLDRAFVEALASGVGPDIIFLPQDLILRHSDKIFPLPLESLSERQFRDTFIAEGEMYLTEFGSLSLPVVVDPLVMYWNRSTLASSGIVREPAVWDEFFELAPKLTQRDNAGDIVQSAVALGEYQNITNAKELISALILQTGSGIVERINGELSSTFAAKNTETDIRPAELALIFYTQFSHPSKPTYSWNRSLPSSQDMFVAGDLAIYFGFASEFDDIRKLNPHLDFDVASLPQVRGDASKKTFGRMSGISIVKTSDNIDVAFGTALMLIDPVVVATLSEEVGLPPARRDLLGKVPSNPYGAVFYESALISDAWLDPDPAETDTIFREMMSDIISGRRRISEAASTAGGKLQKLLDKRN